MNNNLAIQRITYNVEAMSAERFMFREWLKLGWDSNSGTPVASNDLCPDGRDIVLNSQCRVTFGGLVAGYVAPNPRARVIG